MANRVTLSSIGARALSGGAGLSHEQALKKMMDHWKSKVEAVLPDRPDLIVVPEASDRFEDHTKEQCRDYYLCRGDRIRDLFAGLARANRCYIAYSAYRQAPEGTWRNSTQLIDRAGRLAGIYNKNHVVIEETTEAGVLCGKEARVFACDFGRVACAICFDLNFDELRLKYARQKPDLVVFCSVYHGGLMQRYWAYSCRAHFIGAIGGTHPSSIISPVGEILASNTNYFDTITATVNLDCVVAHLDYNWEKLRALKAKHGRGVTVTDPGYLGSVLITSETDGLSARDMAREFEIELLDDYWARALAHHHDPRNIEP
jgi:predicted amidohydrolase